MNAFVIALRHNKESINVAKRTIEGCALDGVLCSMSWGITPDIVHRYFHDNEIPVEPFENNPYSRTENAMACFASHHQLWKQCVDTNKTIIIFEHDAVIINEIPTKATFNKLLTFGKPSYGNYNTPAILGVNPLTSKVHLPGAHAYMIKPEGAEELIATAKVRPYPTDVFINLNNFPWIQEYYPWSAEVRDTFSTVQVEKGCLAKHTYNENYKIIDAVKK